MTASVTRHAHHALLIMGIVFMIIGLNDHFPFIALGAAFIAIGAATARRRSRRGQDLDPEG